jgi:hypothetical protein
MDDRVIVVRDEEMRRYHVVVTAERVVRAECWLVTARVSYDDTHGELHDARKSDYPEETAAELLAEIDAEYL